MKQYYSYENFRNDTKQLIKKFDGFQAEVVVGIARGGLSLSHAIAEGLNIRDVQSIRTEFYDETMKRESISLFGNCTFSKSVTKVILVDDIADSGATLNLVMDYLESNFTWIEFRSATLFYKKSSLYEPDYWVNEAKMWIEFFWEKDFIESSYS